MKSTEIKAKWDETLPTYQIRVGTSRIKNPGKYARVSLSGTEHTAGVFEVDPVNTIRDDEQLSRYVKLNPNVAEAFGYEPSTDSLKRRSVNLRVETPIPERSIPTCSEVTVYTEDFEADVIESYLKNRNYVLKSVTESVPVADVEAHTPYSFDYNTARSVSFEVVDATPSRAALMVRESTTVSVTTDPPRRPSGGRSAEDASEAGAAAADREEDSSQGSYDESEVGEGFDVSPEPPEHTFDDIVGLEEVKERVGNLTALTDDDFVDELENRYGEAVNRFLPEGYTMLLYGPPGCGKTMVAHGIADRFQREFERRPGPESAAFISMKGSDILASLRGQSESRVEATFQEARQSAGEEGYAILFFDEIETLIPDRNSPTTEAHDSRLTVAFLQEMNSIGDNVMVIGATNLPFTIDSAASRRFKRKLFVPHPDEEALAELWRKNLEPLNTRTAWDRSDYEALGKASSNFTPSEIDAMLETEVQSDIVEGIREDDPQPLTRDYFESKLDGLQPRVIEEYISSVDQPDLLSQDQMQGYQELEEYIETNKGQFSGPGET